jgi:hypothetical protein
MPVIRSTNGLPKRKNAQTPEPTTRPNTIFRMIYIKNGISITLKIPQLKRSDNATSKINPKIKRADLIKNQHNFHISKKKYDFLIR